METATMIKESELRIGNYVKWKGEVIDVLSIEGSHINYGEDNGDVYFIRYVELEPISLTPEILEKCGFTKCTCGGWKGTIHLEKDLSFKFCEPIKYLHQLQNLIYALTCEEIEINL